MLYSIISCVKKQGVLKKLFAYVEKWYIIILCLRILTATKSKKRNTIIV